MVGPEPNRLVQWWFDGWCRRAMRRQFYRLHLWGEWPAAPGLPTLYVVNHSSFWDGIVLWRLLRPLHRRLLCAVDAAQMREHPFFARLGCFSIDRTNARRAGQSLAYAAERLRGPGTGLVIFPQGRIEHADVRPVRFERGVGKIIAEARPRVMTVALRYDYWQEQRAEVLIDVAQARVEGDDRRMITNALAKQMAAQLDRLAERSRTYAAAPNVRRVGWPSVSHWKDRFRRGPSTAPRPE